MILFKSQTRHETSASEMEGWLWVTTAICFAALLAVLTETTQKKWFMLAKDVNWPPGPTKLPVIGNLHLLNKGGELVHVILTKLARQYGGLMTVWFGSWEPTIMVSDYELAWEVLVTKASDFSSRKMPYMSRAINADFQTICTSNLSSHWYNLRNGLQSTALSPKNIFKQAPSQENDASDMISNLIKEASSNNGVARPLHHLRQNAVKLIAHFCFGRNFKDDSFVHGMDNAVEEVIRLSGVSSLAHVFKFLRHIPSLNRPFKETDKVKRSIEELIRPFITGHKFSTTPCLDNSYLHFLLSQKLSEQVIIFTLFELFMLGVDSVSTTTAWALALLIHNPQVQQKLFEEVSREVGTEAVRVEDVKKLHYLNAVVKETMRMKPIAPFAIPHRADRDSTIAGIKIPAGTQVVVNLYKLLHDPHVWVEPHRFMPDRFLAASVISREMERSFLPFGAGRRMCAGTELAKLHVPFILASLVHKFKWSGLSENQLPDLSEDLTFVLMMKTPLEAHIETRPSTSNLN